MKSIALLSVVLGLASASPLQARQELDPDSYFAALGASAPATTASAGDAAPELVADTPDSDAVNAAASAAVSEAPHATVAAVAVDGSGLKKRDECVTRTFNGPQVTDPADTPEAFLAYQPFHDAAQNAAHASNIPEGYALITGFVDLQASVKGGDYITYVSSKLTGYDLQTCADLCDNKIDGCLAFNIFYERVPLIIDPSTHTTNPDTCPGTATSPSATLIKCDFFGKPIFPGMATNTGQAEQDFHFVKAGSNAYIKSSAPSVDGYDTPVSYGNAAISIPAPVGANGYIRSQTFGTNVPFSPDACAASCDATSAYNLAHGKAPCNFFDVFVQYLNGENGVLTCNLYSTVWDASYATNVGRHDNSGNHWTIAMSYGYVRSGIGAQRKAVEATAV